MKIVQVPLSTIKTTNRQRKEMGDIKELAGSIKKLGLLQPLILEDNNELRAGERRLLALKSLKEETAPCIYFNQLTEIERLEIELDENSKRLDFTWQEEVELRARLHDLYKKENPDWSEEKTATKLGIASQTINTDLLLAREIKKNPDLVEVKNKSDARRKARRIQERELRSLLLTISDDTKHALESSTDALCYKKHDVELFNIDCMKGITKLKDESIDLIITDFPFGINLDKNFDFNKSWDVIYSDTSTNLLDKLVPFLCKEFARVLKEGHHFYVFFPSLFHEEFRQHLSQHLNLYPFPLIWNKRVGGTSFAPYSRYTPNYEPIWYGWKGKVPLKLTKPGYCVLNFDNLSGGSKEHPAEKPLDLISYLISQSSLEEETVLDCFSGSASTLLSCIRMGRKGIAFELERRWYELGIERINNIKINKEGI